MKSLNRHARKSQVVGFLMGSLIVHSTLAAPTDPTASVNDDAAKWASVVTQQPQYKVAKGDSLRAIAKKIFGSSHFWKKIWAANRDAISNPKRLIRGMTLVFPTEMPSAAALQLLSDAPVDKEEGHHIKKHSTEWKLLPKQPWERYTSGFPEGIDALGFDKRDKILNHPPIGFELQAIPLKERATILGEIFGSRSEGNYFSMNEMVYIKADENIKVGNVYAVTQTPTILRSSKDPERFAYSYIIMGKVKIIGVHSHLFLGRIISSRYFIPRGALLMPLPPRVPEMTPTAGSTSVRGELVMDHTFSTSVTAQFKEVFVDRGSADGVRVGNVFRAYKHKDPSTNEVITKYDFIIDADLLVTRVTENFCSTVVIRSTSPVSEGTTVALIKDLSWLKNYEFDNYADGNNDHSLDTLDDQDGLKPNEAKELQQLESWKDNPDAPPPGSGPEAIPEKLPDSAAAEAPIGEPAPLPEVLPEAPGGDAANAALGAPAPLPEGDAGAPPPLPENAAASLDGAPPPLPESLASSPDGALPPPPSDAPLPDILPPLPEASVSDAGGLPPPIPEAGAPDVPPPPLDMGAPPAAAAPPANGGLMPPLDPGLDSMPLAQDMPPPLPE